MKKLLRSMMKFFVKIMAKNLLETIIEVECAITSRWAFSAHRRLMRIQWGLSPQPEVFDHQIDLFFNWRTTRNSLWLERGVFGSLALRGGNAGIGLWRWFQCA
jgi:hypothetical protein